MWTTQIFLAKVVWVQDPRSSWRLSTNEINIIYRTKKKITHINILCKQLLCPTLILSMNTSVGSRKILWPIGLGLFSVASSYFHAYSFIDKTSLRLLIEMKKVCSPTVETSPKNKHMYTYEVPLTSMISTSV